MNWLFKEEPQSYSFDDLVRDGSTSWSGVRNPLAQRHLRSITKGDRILYYHTGKVKAIVGLARAMSAPIADPADRSGRRVSVTIAPLRPLGRPVTLAEIKASQRFNAFPLVRIPRLSVMPVSDQQWSWILAMGRTTM